MNLRAFEDHMAMMTQREQELTAQGVHIFRLSTTERQEFKECRRRWDFGSLSRQGIEPNRPAVALWFGTGIHFALEQLYKYRRVYPVADQDEETFIEGVWRDWAAKEMDRIAASQGELWDEQVAEFNKSVELGVGMLQGYCTWSVAADAKDVTGFKRMLYTEKEFAVAVPDESGEPYRFVDISGKAWEIWLVGRLDMVVQDWDDRVWILDHKTSKDRLDPEILTLDDQMTMYMWAAQTILQTPVAGCYYNVLRKKLPTVPKVLSSGKGLSKDKSIDTTYEVYLKAIEDNGFDPEDYAEYLNMLLNKDTGFFTRVKVHRNPHEIAMAGRMLLLEAIDMLNAPYIYPNPTWDCRWKCDYKALCLAMNRNDDVEYLRKTLYRKREKEDQSVYNRESTVE